MKKTIAVFFGGQSTEHDISIISALSAVVAPLRAAGSYNIVPVYITKDGKWVSAPELLNIKTYQTGKIKKLVAKAKPVSWLFGDDSMLIVGKKKYAIDIAFPVLHGTYGEDGSIMGLLRMANIPFVGCDMDASVIAMDKVLAKQVATANEIPTSPFVFFSKQEIASNIEDVVIRTQGLSMPLFVKPAHLGSSIGISKVTNESDLRSALELAAAYDEKVIVEEAVENLIEVTVPIIGNETPQPALVEKPLTKSDDFFNFETKYLSSGGKKGGGKKASGAQGYSELPAQLDGNLYEEAERLALKVYKAIGASGIARVDLLIDGQEKKVYFNEVNPLPGSLYVHNWRAAGVSGVDLVEKLLHFAEERYNHQQSINHSFESNFLGQF